VRARATDIALRCALALLALVVGAGVPAVHAVETQVTIVAPEPAPLVPVPEPAPPPPKGTLAVHVIGGGKAIANADVFLSDGSATPLAMRTDGDGYANFTQLAAVPHEVWASGEGMASKPARVESETAIDVELAPAASVDVKVTADAPLAAGTVQLFPLYGVDAMTRTAAIGERGELAIAGLPFGQWRVVASVPGFVQTGDVIARIDGPHAALEVKLQKAGTVSGSVVDTNGNPVANATVVLDNQGQALVQKPVDLASTGMRWLHPLAGERHLPVIEDARFGALRVGARNAECGRGHCGLDIGNERGSVVHAAADGEIAALFPEPTTEAGKVVVIHHGKGLKSYYMHLDELRPGLEVGQVIHAGDPVGLLGNTGYSRILPHLHFAITYEAGGRTWYLDPEPIIRQSVVLAKARPYEPVDTALAATWKRELPAQPKLDRVTTDAKGAFSIANVMPGTYAAGAFAPELATGASPAFNVRADEETKDIVITMSAGVLVEGRVVGRDGPIEGATLIASAGFGETAHKVAMTTTDRHGEFTLRGVGGKVTISATAAKYGEAERAISLDAGDARRGRHREDFTLTIQDATLRGQVFAAEGGAASGMLVRVVDGPTRRTARTDAQGQFVLAPVATGRYTLEVSGPETPAKRVVIDSDRWSEVRLEAGGSVRCLVRDGSTGIAIANARVELVGPGPTVSRTTDTHGLADVRGLAPGDWKLVARVPGYAIPPHAVAIRAGRVADDVILDAVRGATVEGVVRDRYGRRIGGAHVSIGAVATTADADGNFRLADVAPGATAVEAELEGRRGQVQLQLAPGDSRMSVDVELPER